MSNIWKFSPENELLLQRCLNSAPPLDDNNKWVLKFGIRNPDLLPKTTGNNIANDSPSYDDISIVQEQLNEKNSTILEEVLDPEFDIKANFFELVNICLKEPNSLTKLAETLPKNTVETLYTLIFESNDLNTEFLELFFEKFSPAYIKRDSSRFSSNILNKTFEIYPQYLKYTIKAIFNDLDIENNVVLDFISSLSPQNQSEFLLMLSNMNIMPIENHILSIYTAYKTSNKIDSDQYFILKCLKNYSNLCINNKNYGKLMLAYLQCEKSLKRDIISNDFVELIEIHKTPFKKPCLNLFKEIKDL